MVRLELEDKMQYSKLCSTSMFLGNRLFLDRHLVMAALIVFDDLYIISAQSTLFDITSLLRPLISVFFYR